MDTSGSVPRRRLGHSELEVSAVGLGGNTFGPPRLDEQATRAVIDAALELGVNFVDTAILYGQGRSEEFLGRALEGGRRDEMVIATKFHFFDIGDESPRQRIRVQAEESLQKLGTDRIDLYQVHFPDGSVPPEEILLALDDLVQSGKVRAIGASNYASWRLAEAAHVAARLDTPSFATVQNYYHLLARQIEAEVAPFCSAYGLSILPYHPLGGGFLTGKYRRGEPPPPGTRGAAGSGIVTAMSRAEKWDRLAALEAFSEERGHTVAELAIAWLLANPLVGSVIAGVSNPQQLAANVAAGRWELPADDLAAIDRILDGTDVRGPEQPPSVGPPPPT